MPGPNCGEGEGKTELNSVLSNRRKKFPYDIGLSCVVRYSYWITNELKWQTQNKICLYYMNLEEINSILNLLFEDRWKKK